MDRRHHDSLSDLEAIGGVEGVQRELAADGFTIKPAELTPNVIAAFAKLYRERDAALEDMVAYQKNATKDTLTGLPNLEAFNKAFAAFQGSIQRDPSRKVSVVFFDVNKFKSINSQFSHAGGDRALKHISRVMKDNRTPSAGQSEFQPQKLQHIAQVLKQASRRSDFIGRFAGDEFVAILDNTDVKGAKAFINKMMDAVLNSPLEYDGQTVNLSITGGIHQLQPEDTLESAKASASTNMLIKKKSSYSYADTVIASRPVGPLSPAE